jgi:uncharacterized protein YbjT (DUF2867 family)
MQQFPSLSDAPIRTVIAVGASGSVGRFVVAEALRAGYRTRALVRDRDRARNEPFPLGTEVVIGDLTRSDTLADSLSGVDGVIFTHGTYGGAAEAEAVNYGAVLNVLTALHGPARIALMTTIGVTKPTPGHDWKRRGERLVRASGLPYTIVRPGWFDYNGADEHRPVMLQGDTRWAGDPSDGVVARQQIAEVLVASLSSDAANRKTLELVAETGAPAADLDPLFAALQSDKVGTVDGVGDRDNLPFADEPARVLADLAAVRERF